MSCKSSPPIIQHKYSHLFSVHDFTGHLVKPWDLTFYRQFPQEKISYVDNAKILITDLAEAATIQDICPDVPDGLKTLKGNINKTFNLLRNQTDTAFDDMKKVIKKSHKEAVPAVREFLEPMYEHCASESGKTYLISCRHHIVGVLIYQQVGVSTPEISSSSRTK
jgi:hypothetical protein